MKDGEKTRGIMKVLSPAYFGGGGAGGFSGNGEGGLNENQIYLSVYPAIHLSN